MIIESNILTVELNSSEIEFVLLNKEQKVGTIVLRNHVLQLKSPYPNFPNLQNDTTIQCEAISIGPRENLVIIPPPNMGPQAPVITPGAFMPPRRR